MITNNSVILFSFLAVFFKFGIAYLVYKKNNSSEINKLFALLFFFQGIWDLGKAFMWMSGDYSTALNYGKISYTGYIISIFIFPHFAWAYLKRNNIITRHIKFWYIPMFVILIFLWTTNAMISGLLSPLESTYGSGIHLFQYQYGPLYTYFFLWFQSLALFYCLYILTKKYLKTKLNELKNRLKYLIIGISIPIIVGIPTGVLLPLIGYRIFPHNNILTTLMSLFIGYGILKYKFLNIKPLHEESKLEVNNKEIKKFPIESGQYLICTEKSRKSSYNVLLDKLKKKNYGLIITSRKPKEIKKEFNLKTTPIIWLTDSETEELSIGSSEVQQLYSTISDFTKNMPNSIILLDGINYLFQKNSYSKILFLVKNLKSLMANNKSTLIMPYDDFKLTPKEKTSFLFEFTFLPNKTKASNFTDIKSKISKSTKFLALGYDNTIESLIQELTAEKHKINVISLNIQNKKEDNVNFLEGNPLKANIIQKYITNNTVVFVSLMNDSDTMLCINLIRSLSDKVVIIANIHRDAFVPIAEKAGANFVVPSSALGGHLLSISVHYPNVIQWIMDALTHTGKGIELIEKKANKLTGKSVINADKIIGKHYNIIAIKTEKEFMQIPDDKYIIKAKDKILLVKE